MLIYICSVQFSRSVMSDSLWPHEPQHVRPPCPSATPGVHPNPCPLSRWCHPTISSSIIPFSSCSQSFPASGSFQMSTLRIRWPKYWSFSFSISPFSEYSGLIFFKIDCFDLLAVQGTLGNFSSSHVQMWELDHKESWVLKNWCFQTVVLEKILESLLDSKEIKPKGNQPFDSLKGLMLKLKLQYFGHPMGGTDS